MILVLTAEEHHSLLTIIAHNPDAKVLKRAQIALGLAKGESPSALSRRVGCHRSTIYRVGERFEQDGLMALEDGRSKLRGPQAAPTFLAGLSELVCTSPRELGWCRSTWSLELMGLEMQRRGCKRVHPSTIGRYLHIGGFRFNRARPTLISPDPDKAAKLAAIEELKARLGPDDLLFYEDELDVHLNPKIGPQWTKIGKQPSVVTPGNNKKAFIAGAIEHQSGQLVYIQGERKNSELFIGLLDGLAGFYPDKTVHLVLDNYIIHHSKRTQQALAQFGGRIQLHFLPTYSPEHNPIEMLWKDLHACVTRNHDAKTIEELMERVEQYLDSSVPYPGSRPSLERAS